MAHITYHVVPHDGGWAYQAGGVFSEPFRSREAALKAATRVAHEQRTPGETAEIQYQDEAGAWHTEHVRGDDRPEAWVDRKD
jgi:hypothetical protein